MKPAGWAEDGAREGIKQGISPMTPDGESGSFDWSIGRWIDLFSIGHDGRDCDALPYSNQGWSLLPRNRPLATAPV